MNDKVDVLIIGSGASGAAVAWSLADTKMRILCLEQGDWVKPTDYPSNGRDWEARLYTDFATSPNRRARETDYPINDANSPIKVVNFNGVGGSTIMYTAHYPRLHPSDFKVKTKAHTILEAAGARDIGTQVPILNGGWHLLGTARMGNDPERSVVNGWGRCHDVRNLFIVDGSIWVTSGGVNPTSTIQALALYIANSIKQHLSHATLFD